MRFRSVLLLLVCISVSLTSLAAPPKRVTVSNTSLNIDNTTFIDVNRILMFVTNHGNFGRDLAAVFGYDYGTWFPYSGDTSLIAGNIGKAGDFSPLYAAGIWLGGKESESGQIRVAISEYSSEYVPGPMAYGTYLPDNPAYRIYKLYSDSLSSNPNDDYLNWPVDQGAPTDHSGHPLMVGNQMLWSVFNDADPDAHDNDAGWTDPLGCEVKMTTWGLDRIGVEGNCVYVEYRIFNRSDNTYEDFYVALWTDPDLGTAGDDLVGCDTLDQLFFCYNGDNDDGQYGSGPPAIGFKYLVGPLVPSPGYYADLYGTIMHDYRDIGMTGFNKYINGTDPDNFSETYSFMTGLTKSGDPYEYDGDVLLYVHSGDPVTGVGDLDSAPADRRMMGISGPFDFHPGDSVIMLVRMAAGQGADHLSSITVVRNLLNAPFDLPTDIADESPQQLPGNFTVKQNYPNPFNPATSIQYSLPERAHVKIEVFNVLGQKIQSLVDETKPAGVHTVVWDGTDKTGNAVATGMYFYRIQADDAVATKKMVLIK